MFKILKEKKKIPLRKMKGKRGYLSRVVKKLLLQNFNKHEHMYVVIRKNKSITIPLGISERMMTWEHGYGHITLSHGYGYIYDYKVQMERVV